MKLGVKLWTRVFIYSDVHVYIYLYGDIGFISKVYFNWQYTLHAVANQKNIIFKRK